eukprot:gene657-482_t
MGDFQYNPQTLHQLLGTLSRGTSADNAVQQQVTREIEQYQSHLGADFNAYLVFVFAELGPERAEVRELNLTADQLEGLRMQAGLLLKLHVGRELGITPQVLVFIKSAILKAVENPSRNLRNTAGSLITTVLQKVGIGCWLEALHALTRSLDNPNRDVVDGSFSALSKVCEDGFEAFKWYHGNPDESAANRQKAKPFIDFSMTTLLPKLVNYAQPSQDEIHRRYSITVINHFVLNRMFDPSNQFYDGGAIDSFMNRYKDILGVLANDPCPDVVKQVCLGFCYLIEHQPQIIGKNLAQVSQFMLIASKHREYQVRLDALEFWPSVLAISPVTQPVEQEEGHMIVEKILGDLLPILLENMIYSDMDYAAMDPSMIDDDNAAVPDSIEDIKPRFHEARGAAQDDEDDDIGGGTTWGSDWTVRKAAANALDHIASHFGEGILDHVKPLIEAKLENPSWEVQESAVLALGAIGHGCMTGLARQGLLENVLKLLLAKCEHPKPLLRSISCWCVSRFSAWIVHGDKRDVVLKHVLARLLTAVLDRNKRVQEAGCSAFATLEENARGYLAPFLPDIVPSLVKAFDYYQAKNLLILYDAVGTLADSVGRELAQPQYIEQLLPPLYKKFSEVPDNDRALIPLFECLTAMCVALGDGMLQIAPFLVERAGRIIDQSIRQIAACKANPELEKPDREILACSIDLLSGLVEGLRENIAQVLRDKNFCPLIKLVVRDTTVSVRQSGFALMGDLAKFSIDFLRPELPELLPECVKSLDHSVNSVANNASWSMGEVCMKVEPDVMQPFVAGATLQLIALLKSPVPTRSSLQHNACITLSRLAHKNHHQMLEYFPQYIEPWCKAMIECPMDGEKISSFQGFAQLLQANPKAAVLKGATTLRLVFEAVSTVFPPVPQLQEIFSQILNNFKQELGPGWPEMWNSFDQNTRHRLSHGYAVDGPVTAGSAHVVKF